MKVHKIALTLVAASALTACMSQGSSTAATAEEGITLCQASNAVMSTVDQNLPTAQLWEGVLSGVAEASSFTIPSVPGMSEGTKSYYKMGLLALDTTLAVNGCPSSTLKEIMAKEM
jgi:hypothetical protein